MSEITETSQFITKQINTIDFIFAENNAPGAVVLNVSVLGSLN